MILVAGATGVLGMEIVRRLAERRQPVRALVRESSNPDKVRSLRNLGAEIARGDLKEGSTLQSACRGVDAVISTVTAITTAKPGDSFADTDAGGNINLVDASAASGTRQFIFVSFDTDGAVDAPLSRAKRSAEEHIRRSGMTHTILQPSLFMESWLGPMLFADVPNATAKVYGSGNVGIEYIAVADVAETVVQSVTSEAAGNATIRFGGPEAISQRRAVEIFSEELGKPFSVVEVPQGDLERQWSSAEDPFQKSFAALMLAVARGFGGGMSPASTRFPMRMTTVREFAKQQATRS
ncbi:MAG: SDR family oxidoreductase [Gemmatimonadaceae bacterium]